MMLYGCTNMATLGVKGLSDSTTAVPGSNISQLTVFEREHRTEYTIPKFWPYDPKSQSGLAAIALYGAGYR